MVAMETNLKDTKTRKHRKNGDRILDIFVEHFKFVVHSEKWGLPKIWNSALVLSRVKQCPSVGLNPARSFVVYMLVVWFRTPGAQLLLSKDASGG
jgi:hypothetical protein